MPRTERVTEPVLGGTEIRASKDLRHLLLEPACFSLGLNSTSMILGTGLNSWNKDEGLVQQANDFIVAESSSLCEGMKTALQRL